MWRFISLGSVHAALYIRSHRLGAIDVSVRIHGLFLAGASLELHQQKPGSVASASKSSCLGTPYIHGIQKQLRFSFPVWPDKLAYVFFMVWMWVTLKSLVYWSLGLKLVTGSDSGIGILTLTMNWSIYGFWLLLGSRGPVAGDMSIKVDSLYLSLSSLCLTCSFHDIFSPQPRNNRVRGPWTDGHPWNSEPQQMLPQVAFLRNPIAEMNGSLASVHFWVLSMKQKSGRCWTPCRIKACW